MAKHRDMSEQDYKDFEEGKEIFNKISRSLNIMGGDFYLGKGFFEKLNQEHPTLKQAFFRRMIVPIIQHFAEQYEKNWYDDRSKATCQICHEMWKDLKDVYLPYI